MRHVIWQPAVDEKLPDTCIAYLWGPLNAKREIILAQAISVVAAIVPDGFTTPGTIVYDSGIAAADPLDPPILAPVAPPFPLVHTFSGWQQ